MKSLILSLLGAATLSNTAPLTSSTHAPRDADIVPGRYVVQLKPGTSSASITSHHNTVRSLHRRSNNSTAPETGGLAKTFAIGDFNAYSGSFDDATIDEIAALPEVLAVEPDRYVYLAQAPGDKDDEEVVVQSGATWNLGSISHRAPGSTEYVYDASAGEGTFVYVCDTGIRTTHSEFEGRASLGYIAVEGAAAGDTDGHGTHVAALAVGKTYGVAKKAQVIDVKVLDGGSGMMSDALDGISWAANDIVSKGRQNLAVINLSIGTFASDAWDDAIVNAYNMGVLSTCAAGNRNEPISTWSPSRAAECLTVGNIQKDNTRLATVYGSNYGPEMDVFAPGTSIVSAGYRTDDDTANHTGTSQAAPQVAGLVSYLRALEGPMSAAEVTARVIDLSTKDVVGDPNDSPNRLAYNGNGR